MMNDNGINTKVSVPSKPASAPSMPAQSTGGGLTAAKKGGAVSTVPSHNPMGSGKNTSIQGGLLPGKV